MVHHKIHDEGWTGLPLLPADDPQVRSLARPSTAATLNVAAVAAQGARLFREYDPAFADSLLADGALDLGRGARPPGRLRAGAAGADGGGAYDDSVVTDEFYWAAAELFLTTGEDEFEQFVLDQPAAHGGHLHARRVQLGERRGARPARPGHRAERPAGARRGQGVGRRRRRRVRRQPGGARVRLGVLARHAAQYAWGSSSSVANNLVVVGVAYDLTGDLKYSRSVLEGMDYLLGRNGLNQSYVTGWGEVASHQQHSRWFAHSLDPALPEPPAGSLAGGPNSFTGTWDPTMQATFTAGLRTVDVLPRRHLVVGVQRDHGQLELGAVLGGVVRRRPGLRCPGPGGSRRSRSSPRP